MVRTGVKLSMRWHADADMYRLNGLKLLTKRAIYDFWVKLMQNLKFTLQWYWYIKIKAFK